MNFKLYQILKLSLSVSLLICFISIQSCKSKSSKVNKETLTVKTNDTITTTSGLRYIITQRNPDGLKAESGDKVETHYTGTLTNGKKFDSSRDRNETLSFILGKHQVISGWDEGFAILRKGEKATLIIPPTLGYGSQDMGEIPPNSTLIFEVELINIIQPIKYEAYCDKEKDTITRENGLKLIIIDNGIDSIKPSFGQNAHVFYAGYLMDGTKFDGNFGGFDPYVLPVYGASVIEGWKQILPTMNKGMKLRAIIPPNLAYGEKGYPGYIPENATIIFDIFLFDLK